MALVEERVARLEGRVVEHANMFIDFREVVGRMEQRIDGRFQNIEGRLLAMDTKIDGLSTDLATNFRWTVGIMITGFVTGFGAVLAALITR